MDQVFSERRKEALRLWTEAIFSLYPFETTGFLRTQRDRFANPVGHTTETAAGILYNAVTGLDLETGENGSSPADVTKALDELVHIRAIQDLPPSKAVGVLFLLKPVLQQLFLTEALSRGRLAALLDAESRLDTLALMAFDQYMAAKEVVFAARVGELRRRTAQLERWAAGQMQVPDPEQP